jgi:alkylation response protein AidB-like acyl-CoA dehydrogenase
MTLRGGRLRGRAVAVPNLSRAELIVTLARTDASVVVAVARCDSASGVTVLARESTDPAQPVADVEIDAEPLATAPLKSGGVESALTAPLVAAAADLVGVAGAALHLSVEHAKTRRQFGTPIGAFQGIKHALADNHVSVERARSLTYAAAALLADPEATPAAAWTAAALAKAAAGDAATSCARTAVQVHGALGQTWEHDAHLYVRHAWQGAAMLGDSRALYHEVGRRFAGGAG